MVEWEQKMGEVTAAVEAELEVSGETSTVLFDFHLVRLLPCYRCQQHHQHQPAFSCDRCEADEHEPGGGGSCGGGDGVDKDCDDSSRGDDDDRGNNGAFDDEDSLMRDDGDDDENSNRDEDNQVSEEEEEDNEEQNVAGRNSSRSIVDCG